jgi:hypothetical protein
MTTPNELSSKLNRISWVNDKFQEIKINDLFNKIPDKFEAIVLSGEPEQHNSAEELKAFGTEFVEKNDNRYYFVRIMPLKIQGSILPDPFRAKDLQTAKRLINMYPLAYIEVANSNHPPTHGDIYECRSTSKDKRGISLVRRLRNSNEKIGKISNREIHKSFRGTGSTLLGTNRQPESAGFVPRPSGASSNLVDQTPVVAAGTYGQPEKSPPDQGMACSVLTCIWALNQIGKRPIESEWPRWQAWYVLDKDFWRRCQIRGKEDSGEKVTLGSIINIKAYQKKLGGSFIQYTRQQTTSSPPVLTKGRWHVVQRWHMRLESPEEYSEKGHTYLIYYGGGNTVRMIDSSHKHGYKDRDRKLSSWYKRGAAETVLTLPKMGS